MTPPSSLRAFRSAERFSAPRSGHRNLGAAAAALALLFAPAARALCPHELALIVNTNSPESVEIAKVFAEAREIPEINIVGVGLTDKHVHVMGTGDFTRLIWDPVNAELVKRGVAPHIEGWIYSAGFPVSVQTDPEMSITGLTFTRNSVPPKDALNAGAAMSPLFAGPREGSEDKLPSGGFERFKVGLRAKPPLPSMMLGVLGPKGNTVEEICETIRRGVASDATHPEGIVWFVSVDDIRWTCREWEIAPVLKELKGLGVSARLVNLIPPGKGAATGLFTGAVRPDTRAVRTFAPGAIADHLTSFAGFFQESVQTKLTEWIRQGATASSGTVTEPYAIWTKFPHARIFVHQRAGLSIIESYYLSVASPLQLLIVGEPLASPFAPEISFSFDAKTTPEGLAVSFTDVKGPKTLRFRVLVDGRPAGRDRGDPEGWVIPRESLPEGEGKITGIVMQDVPVRFSRQKTVVLKH
ncbi:MAG: TIGR03790 family protein [Kiritimatiellia bacterium]